MRKLGVRRYLIAGILLAIPLWLTFVVVRLLFNLLRGVSQPALSWLVDWPDWALAIVSVVITVLGLYLLGMFGTWVIGKRLVGAFDRLMERIPLVQTVYGGAKKLLNVMQTAPDTDQQRVVLVEFPHPGMRSVGLVTRILTDTETGQDYAAVYVPTTPNPTSGFLELVPMDRVYPSNMTMDEAMTFIISGGAVNPARFVEKKDTGDAGDPAEVPAPRTEGN
jgi:uncharacterized membrane protein